MTPDITPSKETQLEIHKMRIADLSTVAFNVHKNARDKGFYDDAESEMQFLARSTANMHGEVSELWEAARDDKLQKPCDKADKMKEAGIPPLTCEEEELADIIIRACDHAERRGINISLCVARKHAFNRTRPPKHGGKRA
jgi:hypothetical protein